MIALLTATSTAVASPRVKALPKCPPRNLRVLVADAQVVIYRAATVVYEPEEHRFEEGQEAIFGCAHGAKRSYRLGPISYGSASGSGGTYPIALAGPVVAYDVGETAPFRTPTGFSAEEIWVRNLRTGKLLHRMPNGSPAESEDIGLGETTAIVVKGDGAVAWIVRTGRTEDLQVRSADKTGSHVLVTSPEIAPESLALAGSTLYWTQGNKPMSATLN